MTPFPSPVMIPFPSPEFQLGEIVVGDQFGHCRGALVLANWDRVRCELENIFAGELSVSSMV